GATGSAGAAVQIVGHAVLILIADGERTALRIHLGAGGRIGAAVIGVVNAVTVAVHRGGGLCRLGFDAKQVVEADLQGAIPVAVILTVEAQGFHSDIDPLMDFPFDAEARIVGGAAVVAALIRISPEIANARQRIGAPTAIQVQVVKDITVPPAPLHILAAAVLVQFHPVTHQPYRPLGGELITEPQANR